MERTLSLVLDEEGFKSLTLKKDDAVKIDEFTTKKFENSEQIRDYFELEIAEFLEQNKNYLNAINQKGRMFRGRIVILEAKEKDGNTYFVEKRVLYKKHIIAIKEIVKDRMTMQRFLNLEKIGFNQYGFRKLISPFLTREIKYANYKVKSQVDFIRRELKRNKKNFFDILRIIVKAYEIERQTRPNLKTIEAIYKESCQIQPKDFEPISSGEAKEYYVLNGVRYHIDCIPFDLDDLKKMETDYFPDGLKDIHEKRFK